MYWTCFGCGECCRNAVVYLHGQGELLRFLDKHRWDVEWDGSRWVLRRKPGGRCVFHVKNLCSIQPEKPLACKLWPFQIRRNPLRVDDASQAEYIYKGKAYYVYVDVKCTGAGVGLTVTTALPELVGMYEGEQTVQICTKSPNVLLLRPIAKLLSLRRRVLMLMLRGLPRRGLRASVS